MIEVMRRNRAHEMCRPLTHDLGYGKKYQFMQSSENGDLLIATYESGCWCELDLSFIADIMNKLDFQNKQYEAREYDDSISLSMDHTET